MQQKLPINKFIRKPKKYLEELQNKPNYQNFFNFLQVENLEAGIYMVSVRNDLEQESNIRLIVQ